MIVKSGKGRYVVKSESGKRLSKPLNYSAAKKRLAQVEALKAMHKRGR